MPAEIPDGAVIVARAILSSSIWSMRSDDVKVAMTCIALANFKPAKWHDGKEWITIKKGQFIRSRERLAKKCKPLPGPASITSTESRRSRMARIISAGGTPAEA